MTAVDTCMKNMEPPSAFRSCTQQPSPSRRKGHSSSELSSLEGVWLPRKLEKRGESERKWEKVRENGKEQEKLAVRAKNLFIGQKVPFYSVYKWLI